MVDPDAVDGGFWRRRGVVDEHGSDVILRTDLMLFLLIKETHSRTRQYMSSDFKPEVILHLPAVIAADCDGPPEGQTV